MFEVTFTNVSKTVATMIEAGALVKQVKALFGGNTTYAISEINTNGGKVVEQNPIPEVSKIV